VPRTDEPPPPSPPGSPPRDRRGDPGALFDRHVGWVHGVVGLLASDAAVAARLAEDALADALRAHGHGTGGHSFVALLAAAAVRRAVEQARRSGGHDRLRLALLELPPRERALLLLRLGGKLPLAEAAEALGLPPRGAGGLQLAALRRLDLLLRGRRTCAEMHAPPGRAAP
jgi:DNA-directed RNA polymerase specialized sigma24 family protein